MYPIRLHDYLGIPCRAVDDSEIASLLKSLGWNGSSVWVLNYTGSGTVHVSVNVEVTLVEIASHNELILLSVTPTNDQVVFRRDKPEKFFKLVYLARLDDRGRDLDILEGLHSLALSTFKRFR